jgi:hypothetical protein
VPTRAPRKRTSHYGQPGNTITGTLRQAVIDDIKAGELGRNAIAKKHGLSGSTVSGIAKAEGLEFRGRTQVAAATQARKVDLRSRRAEIAAVLLEDADRLRGQMWRPCTLHAFGGKDNVHNSIDLAEPIFADKLKLMQAAASALGRHMDLEQHDADEAAANARSMLGELGRALGVRTDPT